MSRTPPLQHLPIRAFQWDLARQVERLDFLLQWLPRYAEWGYEELYLHLEDAVEYPSLPGVARRDAYSCRQFARLVAAASRVGIKVVPIVNLLGHTQYLIKVPELRDLNELRDPSGRPLDRGQLCPLHPRTLEIAGRLLRDLAPFCTAGKVHVGLDESFHLGQCPRCQADVGRRGLAAHFAGHVEQLHQLTTGMGLRMGLWADMLALLPAAMPLLPRDLVAYDWYYYPFARHPRVELRNFAEMDLAAPLQARGIEYWGCPMNGAFRCEPMPVFGDRLANILSWWKRCRRVGAGGFLVTSWEANRLAIELTTTVDAAAACLWLEPGIEDPREMLARGLARVFGGRAMQICRAASPHAAKANCGQVEGKILLIGGVRRPRPTIPAEWQWLSRIALAGDEHAFAGYHRWQINDRWDICAERDGLARYEREERALRRLCKSLRIGSGKIAPPALRASMAFRVYLAQRDVFVRRNANSVFQLRRMLIHSAAASAGERITRPERQAAANASGRLVLAQSLAGARGFLKCLPVEAVKFAAALRAGRAAARAMWNRSRDRRQRGPNELMLARDTERLSEWLAWLRKAQKRPAIVWQATPVCGAWQLQFTLHNFAPALQKIVVEQCQPDGAWTMLYESHLIEFRAFAARPRTRIRREFSVPIPAAASVSEENAETLKTGRLKPEESPAISRFSAFPIWFAPLADAHGCPNQPSSFADACNFPSLRLAVRGVGQVALSRVELTDGVVRFHPTGWSSAQKSLLGRPAPDREFPEVDWTKNQDSRCLTFSPDSRKRLGVADVRVQ